jgi:hypothetical protein
MEGRHDWLSEGMLQMAEVVPVFAMQWYPLAQLSESADVMY